MHPNGGGIIFTDPGYGSHWHYEGTVRELELPTSVYFIDAKGGKLVKLTDEIKKPNGLCFSPDYPDPVCRRYRADALPQGKGEDYLVDRAGQRQPAHQPP